MTGTSARAMTVLATVALLVPCLADTVEKKNAAADNEKLAVFVLAGQSNMQGSGEGKRLPADLRKPRNDVLIFAKSGWAPLKPGGRFGPEVTFARAMADKLGRPVGIIKFAVSGSSLVHDWHPNVKENFYAATLKLVKSAKSGRSIEIMGMLWMQGERDSLSPGTAKKYAQNLDTLVKSLRRDYGAPEMPFVLGRVNPPRRRYKHVGLVRKAQEKLSLPNTAWIDCDGLPKHRDNVHYNTRGQIEMGKRFAAAMAKLLNLDE